MSVTKVQLIATIIFSIYVAIAYVVAKSLLMLVFGVVLGSISLLYLKGNPIVVKIVDKIV